MFCPHCGSSTIDAHGTCQECGQETFDSSTDLEIQAISVGTGGNCPQCGAPFDQGELFCGQCGARVGDDPDSETSLVESQTVRASTPRRTRGLPPAGNSAEATWDEAPPDVYEAPTETYRRTSTPRGAPRSHPSRGLPSRGPTYRHGSSFRSPTGKPYREPAPRSHVAFIVGLCCFLASFITGGAAIWLALTSLH